MNATSARVGLLEAAAFGEEFQPVGLERRLTDLRLIPTIDKICPDGAKSPKMVIEFSGGASHFFRQHRSPWVADASVGQ